MPFPSALSACDGTLPHRAAAVPADFAGPLVGLLSKRRSLGGIMKDDEGAAPVDRRSFLKGAAAAGAAVAAGAKVAAAADVPADSVKPVAKKLQSETFITRPGSDFMTDVLKGMGLQYVAINPAAGFRSLHESIVNYGANKNPEILTCLHEESAAGVAHGYAKAAGKPMGVMLHGTVGLQHGSMALYNAWCDRVPMIVF